MAAQSFYKLTSLLCVATLVRGDHASFQSCGVNPHGSTVEVSKFYYRCSDGMMDPLGCMDGSNGKVPIGGTFRVNNYMMRCKLGPDGFMATEYHACIIKDSTVVPGGTFENDRHWFTCVQQGNYIVEQLSGCMRNGRRLSRRDRYVDGDIVYECRDTETVPELAAVGCVDVTGKQYNIGETFSDEMYLYTCAETGGKPRREAVGCMHGDKRLFSWQTYTTDDTVVRCEVQKDAKTARHNIVGCISKDDGSQKSIGCHWTAGKAPWRYTMLCEGVDAVPTAVVQSKMNCIYGDVGGDSDHAFIIEPGCFRTVNKHTIGCKNGTTGIEFVTFEPERMDIAFQHGLQLC